LNQDQKAENFLDLFDLSAIKLETTLIGFGLTQIDPLQKNFAQVDQEVDPLEVGLFGLLDNLEI
jgi:hypothetical protein